jgi:hypothetical protein
MLPLLIAGGALALGDSLFKTISGLHQKSMANKINDTRPTYKIPSEINQNVNDYQAQSGGMLPGQALMENKLNEGMSSDINAIRQTGGSATNQLAAIAGLNANRNNAINDLNIKAAQFRSNALDKLAGARDVLANYKDQEFDYNKNQEFQYNRMKKNMLLNAGNQNINTGIGQLGKLGGQMMGMGMYGFGGGTAANSGGA